MFSTSNFTERFIIYNLSVLFFTNGSRGSVKLPGDFLMIQCRKGNGEQEYSNLLPSPRGRLRLPLVVDGSELARFFHTSYLPSRKVPSHFLVTVALMATIFHSKQCSHHTSLQIVRRFVFSLSRFHSSRLYSA